MLNTENMNRLSIQIWKDFDKILTNGVWSIQIHTGNVCFEKGNVYAKDYRIIARLLSKGDKANIDRVKGFIKERYGIGNAVIDKDEALYDVIIFKDISEETLNNIDTLLRMS